MARLILRVAGILIAVVILGIAILTYIFWPRAMESSVIVANKTSEEIVELRVAVCDFSAVRQHLAAGAEAEFTYLADCEGEYRITAQLASGRTIDQGIGYVTVGLAIKDRLSIAEQRVTIEALSRE